MPHHQRHLDLQFHSCLGRSLGLKKCHQPVLTLLALLAMAMMAAGCQSNAVLRKQALDAMRRQHYTAALTSLTQAVDQDGADWRAQYYLGQVYLELNQPLQAQMALEKALTVRYDFEQTPGIIDHLALALYQQQKEAQLLALLTGRCKSSGKSADFMRKAKYLVKLGDVDSAIVAYRKAARFGKRDPKPYLALADLYESISQPKRAIDALRRAYGLDPQSRRTAGRLRGHGIVPGPTIAIDPDLER